MILQRAAKLGPAAQPRAAKDFSGAAPFIRRQSIRQRPRGIFTQANCFSGVPRA